MISTTYNWTTELRRLLDERDVKWWEGKDERKTHWVANDLTWEYIVVDLDDVWLGFLSACEGNITPEQAIVATLGNGMCENIDILANIGFFKCSKCGISDNYVPNYCPNCGAKVLENKK